MILLLVTLLPGFSRADDREKALKAGFIYNFARYSEGEWFNSDKEKQYIICTTDPVFQQVATDVLKEHKVKSKSVLIDYIGTPDSLQKAHCHSIFISLNTPNTKQYLQSSQLKRTMVVGESRDFIKQGGHINFFIAGGKVRFEVAPNSLEENGIKLSSKVLRMGRVIEDVSK
ncbi:YfiR family protein [Vibrio sp. WJH972]